jgi:GntR family transcriptional regulator/MocR family aminotransferase
VPELREALAGYLARVRGAAADPEHLIVCTGFRQGLALTCRWLRANGIEDIALEEPGWHAQRLIVEEAGLTVVPVPVDEEGVDVAALEASGTDAIIVTPAHQFPTGVALSARRRTALIEWAERGDGLIIEDDYDAELRRDRLGALQGLAPDRVLYIGSASKRLTPGMRLGWMLPPSWLSWSLITAKAIEDAGSEIAGQLALADFIVRGELERHLRRMRLRYEQRRKALLGALALHLASWQPSSAIGGLHLTVLLPDDLDEPSLIADAARHDVGIEGLSLHSYNGDCPPGLVLGHAYMAEPVIERGVQRLAESLRPPPAYSGC